MEPEIVSAPGLAGAGATGAGSPAPVAVDRAEEPGALGGEERLALPPPPKPPQGGMMPVPSVPLKGETSEAGEAEVPGEDGVGADSGGAAEGGSEGGGEGEVPDEAGDAAGADEPADLFDLRDDGQKSR